MSCLLTDEEETSSEGSETTPENKRLPRCARCRNHGEDKLLKGHKRSCQYRICRCDRCILVEKRQKVMAQQLVLRKRHKLAKRSCAFPKRKASGNVIDVYSDEEDIVRQRPSAALGAPLDGGTSTSQMALIQTQAPLANQTFSSPSPTSYLNHGSIYNSEVTNTSSSATAPNLALHQEAVKTPKTHACALLNCPLDELKTPKELLEKDNLQISDILLSLAQQPKGLQHLAAYLNNRPDLCQDVVQEYHRLQNEKHYTPMTSLLAPYAPAMPPPEQQLPPLLQATEPMQLAAMNTLPQSQLHHIQPLHQNKSATTLAASFELQNLNHQEHAANYGQFPPFYNY